jgi:hypothetical protein
VIIELPVTIVESQSGREARGWNSNLNGSGDNVPPGSLKKQLKKKSFSHRFTHGGGHGCKI